MNRPPQPGRRFVHQFADGTTRAVARFNKKGTAAVIRWNYPPGRELLPEYECWKKETLQAMGAGGPSRWADFFPW